MITGITVCVNFWDFLSVTLRNWSLLCDRIYVITDMKRSGIPNLFIYPGNVIEYKTDIFYASGAYFNKGAAIEELLNSVRIEDYILFFDSDILLPKEYTLPELKRGKLYSASRKIVPIEFMNNINDIFDKDFPIEYEEDFAGYFQLFHSDSVPRPWYATNWKHAGGSDSVFQNKFENNNKRRLNFYVYHLGEPYTNWFGRSQPYNDGTYTYKEEKCRILMKELREKRMVSNNIEDELIL